MGLSFGMLMEGYLAYAFHEHPVMSVETAWVLLILIGIVSLVEVWERWGCEKGMREYTD